MSQSRTISYPSFGSSIMEMQYASDTAKSYRYGFNNQEKDDEIVGKGDYYSFENRIHDARIGRFLSIDPLSYEFPFWSPYCFAANSPIYFIDIFGESPSKGGDGPGPRVGSPNVRRGLTTNNNRTIITQYTTMRVSMATNNRNSNNRNNSKINKTPTPKPVVVNTTIEEVPATGGAVRSPDKPDLFEGVANLRKVVKDLEDLFFIETIHSNSQGVTSLVISAGYVKNSETAKFIEAKEKVWQDGLNKKIQAIYDKKPVWNEAEYSALTTKEEKEAYQDNFKKQSETYYANLTNSVNIAKLVYTAVNGKSPLVLFNETALEFYAKNIDKLKVTNTVIVEQPVVYATPPKG